MAIRQMHYFETSTRIMENLDVAAKLKKRLEHFNNLAWKALAEIQDVSEAIGSSNSELSGVERAKIIDKMLLSLRDMTQQHKSFLQKSISDLENISGAIAHDLEDIEKMAKEKDAFEFQSEFKAVGKMVVHEFSQPAPELAEAEELQGLMEKFNSELMNIA